MFKISILYMSLKIIKRILRPDKSVIQSVYFGVPCDIYFTQHYPLCYTPQVMISCSSFIYIEHDDVIKWKHFPRYWPSVRGIQRPPVNSPHKRQWRGALTFSLICARINGWINNRKAGDLRRNHAHYDVSVMNEPCSEVFMLLDLSKRIEMRLNIDQG